MCATLHWTSGAASSSWCTSALTAQTAARVPDWLAAARGSGQDMVTTTKEVRDHQHTQQKHVWHWSMVLGTREGVLAAAVIRGCVTLQPPGLGH
jgi:hypothetical protein